MIHKLVTLPAVLGFLLLTSSAAAQPQADADRLNAALAALQPQRPGVVDAYVVVAALDTDPVFSREAREAGKVLAQRFDAAGRTIVLGKDEGDGRVDADGTPPNLAFALARAAELMDEDEDVIVLYTTSHGVPNDGIVYRGASLGAYIRPQKLADGLGQLGFKNRLIMIQACFSGQFVPVLKGSRTIIFTAAAADRSSFGCQAGNDWTYFGDALINHAFRQPLPLDVEFRRAMALIAAAEKREDLTPSNPQLSIGDQAQRWLAALDARAPKSASSPVGTSVLGLAK